MSETVYEYDEAGRVISRTKNLNQRNEQHETFVWNGFNQLTLFNDKHHNQWFYKYDGLGRRISKECPEQNLKVEYVWDGDQLALVLTFKQDKLIHKRHSVFNGWELLAQQDNYDSKFTTHYGVSQPNGKILGLFTPEGELSWKAEKRTLWGICFNWHKLAYPNPLDPEMLFAGQWLDSESGLAYNRFRYYDPETGNYLCLDPIGLNGGETPYSYVYNPWDWVDLWGLKPVPFEKWINNGGTGYTNYISKEYTGITNDFPRRRQQHAGMKGRIIEIPNTGNLTKNQSRSIEQAIIHNRRINGNLGLNKINSISPKREIYDKAVNWGEDWIRKNNTDLAKELGIVNTGVKKCK